MNELNIYFSDIFDVEEALIEEYGAVNISLLNDMPLFVDPFLLFNSEKEEYQRIHEDMIKYLLFLQMKSEQNPNAEKGMLDAWFLFSEIKQNWMGFSVEGNSGRGLGRQFAVNLHAGLRTIFKDFGKEKITQSSHLEKLCLISPLVGKDKISDFTTNFTKKYILEYTEEFAKAHIDPSKCKRFNVTRVEFNYETCTWKSREYLLPCFDNEYVLLTPKDMLTRDDTFINKMDMIDKLQDIAPSVSDETIRFELNHYLGNVLPLKKKEMSKKEKEQAAQDLITKHPVLIDHYIKYKEDTGDEASAVSEKNVEEVRLLFNEQLQALARLLKDETSFYETEGTAFDEALKRVNYLKHVIEDMDGYRLFYVDGKPLKRESDLQILYRLVWYATSLDVNREVNNGRGPVDYKISKGRKDSALVEFKLASNSKLKMNLQNQVKVYEKANDTNASLKVIMYFEEKELDRVNRILDELELTGCENIILIDARSDNKPSASNV